MPHNRLAIGLDHPLGEDGLAVPARLIAGDDSRPAFESDSRGLSRAILIALPLAAVLWLGLALLLI